MKIGRLAFLATMFAGIIAQGFAADKPSVPYASRVGYEEGTDFKYERTIAPGVRHLFESVAKGPLTYNAAIIDMSRPDLMLEVEKAKDLLRGSETLPSMMKRLADPDARPLVGINGDFWGAHSLPINMFVDEGTVWKLPGRPEGDVHRCVFAFDDQKNLFIGIPDISALVTSANGAQSLAIGQVNAGNEKADVSLYNWANGQKVPAVPEGAAQFVLNLDSEEWLPNAPCTATVGANQAGELTLDHRTAVLHVKGEVPAWLAEGKKVALKSDFKNLPGKVLGVIGGGPHLLENGEQDFDRWDREEGTGKQFITDLHPRTAVGLLPDHKTLVLVVVDGRQPRKSIGNALPTLANYMKSLGCVDAMNLDGGGSSSMVVAGDVVNFPSDAGGPRALSNGLIVRRTAPLGPLAKAVLMPNNVTVPPGATVDFLAQGQDASGEQISVDGARLKLGNVTSKEGADWMAPQAVPSVSVTSEKTSEVNATLVVSDGRKFPTEPAKVTVVKATKAEFVPHALLLSKGDQDDLMLHFSNDSGAKYYAGAYMKDIKFPDFLKYDPATHTVTALKAGSGKITYKTKGLKAEAPVAVDKFSEQLVDSFDTLPADPAAWMVLANANEKKTTLELDTKKKKEGAASWKFTYAMAKGGTTKISLPIAQDIPGNPPALGLWIFGDGNEHWLRGILEDSKGGLFYADFTNTKAGISWKNEWKFARATMQDPSILKSDHPAPIAPFKLRDLYLIQPQEAAKKNGTIWIDGLTALDVPK
ncbi:hypothetical protein BH09SUM1_BH09SUM1_05890 [soil metagenome]